MATHPLTIWSITTCGGLLLFLLLLRRSKDDDDRLIAEGLVIAAAAAPALAPVVSPMGPADPPPTRPVGRATMLPPVPPRTFEKPAAKGAERTKVAYRRVRLSSKPDAVRSRELGRLDRGDEVEIVDSYEGFLQVRTPDEITGWIPRHTIVGAPPE